MIIKWAASDLSGEQRGKGGGQKEAADHPLLTSSGGGGGEHCLKGQWSEMVFRS
jgi:hypothetical protein